jgi:tetratricopeptide (TPR) repeat protein
MPQVKAAKSHGRPVLVAGLVTLLVVIAVAGYFVWRIFPTAADTVKQADALNAKRQYNQAETILTGAYNRALTKDDKALVLSRLAATSANRGRLGEALKRYEELDQLNPGQYATLISIAQIAERLQRKDAALRSYRQALSILKTDPSLKDSVTGADEQAQLESRIKELEK